MNKHGFRIALAVVLGACFAGFGTPAECSILYVRSDGNDANAGDSWETAKQTVQGAIALVDSTDDEIWVAEGVYAASIPDTSGPTLTIRLSKGCLYGGFSGSETDCSERNPGLHPTVLETNADQGGVVAIVADTTYPTAIPVLDGFTIRGGSAQIAQAKGTYFWSVGGIYCTAQSAVISNNCISGNGIAIYCTDSSPQILSNRIVNNSTGIACLSATNVPSSPLIANNVISGNGSEGRGNAIRCDYTSYSAPTGVSCTITNNTIVGNAGCGDRGAVYIGCGGTFVNNLIAFNASGLCVSGTAPVVRSNCVFGNTAYNYSGITDPTGVDGNRSEDPKLVSHRYGQLHIMPDSPCRDAGLCSAVEAGWLDMDGQARIQGAHVDIGADETDGNAWADYLPAVVHVSIYGDDAADGLTWDSAKRSVQAAIDTAALTGGEVWVAKGTYNEQISLQPYVYVYGGFRGDEESRDQRNWATNRTILDAQGHGTVVWANLGDDVSAIDGFTIRGGGVDSSVDASIGGGVACFGASPVIANNTIEFNNGVDGGGIFCSQSAAKIINNVIQSNYSERGGGVCFGNPTTTVSGLMPVLINNTITGNGAADGGGVYCELTNVTAANNIVAFNTSGVSVNGGTPAFKSNCVYGNTAYNYSGITDPTGVNGNQSQDPKLVAWKYGKVRIQPSSPCKDAGDDTVVASGWLDMDGQPRIQGDHVDIGADESNGQAWSDTPTIIRVSTGGNDLYDGSDWSSAKRSVQAAIDTAAITGGNVWVAAGSYKERVTLPGYVYLYGGFPKDGGDLAGRNPKINQTVLDADKGGSVVTAKFGMGCVDGFTLQSGSGTIVNGVPFGTPPVTYGQTYGGGVYATTPLFSVANCYIAGNRASYGAGVYGPVAVSNCTVSGNEATDCGGGLYCYGPFGVIADTKVMVNTSQKNGGGIAGPCTATNVTVLRNRAYGNGGGAFGLEKISNSLITGNDASHDGGGVSGCMVTENCVIRYNTADGSGGGAVVSCSTSSLKGCTITENKAYSDGADYDNRRGGGGVLCRADADILGNTISDNRASSAGGGVCYLFPKYVWQALNISENLIKNNEATTGGGVSCSRTLAANSNLSAPPLACISRNQILSNTASDGGGIFSFTEVFSQPAVIGNVIANNSANRGGGLSGAVAAFVGNTVVNNQAPKCGALFVSGLTFTNICANNIFAFHKAAFDKAFFAPESNAFYNPEDSNKLFPDGPDPRFVGWRSGDYHLAADSPCRGKGQSYEAVLQNLPAFIPTLDIDGQKRVYKNNLADAGVDIGADEWWPGIGDAKRSPTLGSVVDLSGVIVTANFLHNTFYVETQDRTCGLRVELNSTPPAVGTRVDLTGKIIRNTNGELMLLRPALTVTGTALKEIEPLALNNQSLGGGRFGLQDGVLGWKSILDSNDMPKKIWGPVSGLNNIGLLVKTWGKVGQIGNGGFTIDDGAGVNVKCVLPPGIVIPRDTKYVEVTGISSCQNSPGGLLRVLLVRCQDDIVPVTPQQ